ncbi:MAG: hypothetical protein V4617_10020 [Gemmatimonadota bacterium]
MGQELGEVFTELSNQLTWQFWRWSQFEKLFGSDESQVTVLNSTAPMFFGTAQDLLWLDTLLGISRLAGPASTGGCMQRLLYYLSESAKAGASQK